MPKFNYLNIIFLIISTLVTSVSYAQSINSVDSLSGQKHQDNISIYRMPDSLTFQSIKFRLIEYKFLLKRLDSVDGNSIIYPSYRFIDNLHNLGGLNKKDDLVEFKKNLSLSNG
ncbi:MAG TPA: hypothetical protein VKA26_10375 [Ignavibacteriaceae bacterium]|nr:hypothetical protein [Ignavibacteriaceae bacterium]